MTRPADRALRVALAGLACVAAWDWYSGVAGVWIAALGFGAAVGAVGQWCLTRGLEGDR